MITLTELSTQPVRESDRPWLLIPEERASVLLHETESAEKDFVSQWVTYGSARTDAPRCFHEGVAFVLVASAVNRNRYLDLQHKRIYPSISGLLLADSGRRKTTPLNYGKAVVVSAFPGYSLANEYTAESIISDLASRENGARGTAFIDEAGRLLSTMRSKGYAESLKDLLANLWDAPESHSRKLRSGDFELQSVYVNLLLATTRSRFGEMMTRTDIESGFLARFLPFVSTEPIVRRPLELRTSDSTCAEAVLIAKLKAMREHMASSVTAMPIQPNALARLDLAEVGLDAWAQRQYEADLVLPWARRLTENAQRLSLLLAVSEGADEVALPHVLRAIAVIEHAMEGVTEVVTMLTLTADAKEAEKLFRFLCANPGASQREIQRHTHLPKERVDRLIERLRAEGRVWEEATQVYPMLSASEGHAK